MGVNLRITSGPAVERSGDLAAILTNLHSHDVLFIDEIHRLNRAVEEVLYPAMEDFGLDIVIGKGAGARSLRLNLPEFTLIGATTRFALLSPPLRDRFGAVYRLDFYEEPSIKTILKRSAAILQVKAEGEGLSEIARRARGTPRVANRLLKRVRDYAQVKGSGLLSTAIVDSALEMEQIDPLGLDELDRSVLRALATVYEGGPAGIEAIAATLGEERDTLEDVVEPYLLQIGFIRRTKRGREITPRACDHLGLTIHRKKQEAGQPQLFDAEQA
jgi:Holliday junction DNA helicase RuvB